MFAFLAVGAGGAIGSMLRYAVTLWMVDRVGPGFPWHTIAINVVGSFLIGAFAAYAQSSLGVSPFLSAFVVVGVLGGFTTFSTFSFDTLTLSSEGAAGVAFAYCAGSVIAGLLSAAAGVAIVRAAVHAAS
jgi:CrcB protein